MMLREALPTDIPQLWVLLNALREETVWGTLPFEPNYEHGMALFVERIASNAHCLLVVEDDVQLVGFIGGSVDTHPFIPDFPYLMEWAMYVLPECRNRKIGNALWESLKSWGQQHGARGAAYGKPRKGVGHGWIETVHWELWGAHDRVAV